MDITQLFWWFFIVTALQPVLRQRMLESARQRLIARIEEKRRSRVILLVHRQETMSLLGFPVLRYIDIQDAEAVMRACELTEPGQPLDLVLHTPGGLVLPSLQIARAVRAHRGRVTVFVPHYAMSGGTLIALAADEIVMSPHAALGPVDPQIGQFPAHGILRAVERKPVSELDDQTLILADIAEKAVAQMRESAAALLTRSLSTDDAQRVAELLATGGRWTHDYPITPEIARSLGLHVSTEMPPEILQLMALYPQPARQSKSVEYLPSPAKEASRRSP